MQNTLEELNLTQNRIQNTDLNDYLLEPISDMANLKHLRIGHNPLNGQASVKLIEAIRQKSQERGEDFCKLETLSI